MEIINFTAKCSKCLTCAEYMYGCRGGNSIKEVDTCEGYEFDEHAYVRQDRDETYIPSHEKAIEELNEHLKLRNKDKEKVNIKMQCSSKIVKTLYLMNVPQVDDNIDIDGTYFNVRKRMLQINPETQLPEWNIYVILLKLMKYDEK